MQFLVSDVDAHFKELMIPFGAQAKGTGGIKGNTVSTKLTCVLGAPLSSKAAVLLLPFPGFKRRKKIQVSWYLKILDDPRHC